MKNDDRTQDLVNRAVQGDDEAVGDLYRLYERRLEIAVRARLGAKLRDRLETRDLIQSVWKDALPGVEEFDYRGPDSFFRWLSQRILHKIHDKAKYYGAEKRDPARERRLMQTHGAPVADPHASGPTPSQALIADEESGRLFEILERLPTPQRRAIVLRTWDGLTYREIGERYGESADTIRKRYELGVRKLQDLLERERRGDDGTFEKEPRGPLP